MNQAAQSFVNKVSRISRFAEVLSEISLVLLMLMVFKEVVSRYIFDDPSVYSVEISEYILIFMTFMSAAWILRQDRHVNMPIIADMLPERGAIILDIITSLLTMVVCFIVVKAGIHNTLIAYRGDYRSASLLNFPLWFSYSIICLGFVLLFLQYIARLTIKISRFIELGKR